MSGDFQFIPSERRIVFNPVEITEAVRGILQEEMGKLADTLEGIMKKEAADKPDNPSIGQWYTDLSNAVHKLYVQWEGDTLVAAVGREMTEGGNPLSKYDLGTIEALVVTYGMTAGYTKPGEITYHKNRTSKHLYTDKSKAPEPAVQMPDSWNHPGNDFVNDSLEQIKKYANDMVENVRRRAGAAIRSAIQG